MFGKVMSIPDDLMEQWFRLATELPEAEVSTIVGSRTARSIPPRPSGGLGGEDRQPLPRQGCFAEAEAASIWSFGTARLQRMCRSTPPGNDTVHLPGVLHQAGLVTSTSEARRLIAQGAVRSTARRCPPTTCPDRNWSVR